MTRERLSRRCITLVDGAPDPIITVTARPTGQEWLLVYACPWCPPKRGRPVEHSHPGGPLDDDPADGWRMSHCTRRGQDGVPAAYTMVLADPPLAEVTADWSARSGYWALTIARCPLCGRKHFHDGGDGPEPDLGFRQAHCVDGPCGSYDLVLAATEGRGPDRGAT